MRLKSESLALYIHWPFCKAKCPYCDFNSHVRDSIDHGAWKKALLSEMEYMAQKTGRRTLHSIFFGGGTPSLMPTDIAAALIARAKQLWPTNQDIEITLEANPTSVEARRFEAFADAGVNRVSLGIQSLHDDELQFLGREHSAAEALEAVACAGEHFKRYNFDLIYARPNQTVTAWEKELEQALKHTRGHLSLYQLTIEQNTAFHTAYAKKQFTLPDEATAEALYRTTEDILKARGMLAYEVSNYAAPGEQSTHNLAYWQGYDYVGIGPGAHGRITQNATRHATTTLKSPERWLSAVQKNGHAIELWDAITQDEEAQERLLMGLRLTDGIDLAAYEADFGIDLNAYLSQKHVSLYRKHGLITEDPDILKTTLKGRLVLNQLISELLA